MLNYAFFLRNIVFSVLAICVVSSQCFASVEISATNSGWYRSIGTNFPTSPNYVAGTISQYNYRNFFVFDLSAVTETILSATLKLENPQITNNSAPSTYTLYDVSTSVSALMASQTGSIGTGIYTDLGSGISYGSIALNSTIGSGMVEVTLNSDAIAAMNATTGLFAFGGSLIAGNSSPAVVFNGTSGSEYIRTLVLELAEPVTPPASTGIVPEPASMLVWCGVGLVACLGAAARRKS
jgi:hypothetical protein